MAGPIVHQTRRNVLRFAALAAAASVIAPGLAHADAKAVEAELKKLYNGKAMADGKVKLDVPQIAENGLVVPITIDVESPMTEQNYVKAVHVFADGNPLPGVFTFRFSPLSGRASASTRMRLAQTQNIIAVAEMSDGSLFTTKAEVKVTIGGCGG